jgi:GrpB-like predicted nucleotidyltransferase (UPF0157 family)
MADFNLFEGFELAEYDPNWPAMFESESTLIAEAMGDDMLEIEHMGSTSVLGLRAKPIIDILLVVESFTSIDDYKRRLGPLGYQMYAHQDFDEAEHLFMWKGAPRTHHLHIVEYATWEHYRHLLFRDYLRQHPDVARQYEDVKLKLADAFVSNRPAYTKGKTAFIKSIVAFALEEIADPSLRELADNAQHPKQDKP